MLTFLYRAAATWTALGLASGLFYREFTKMNGVPGGTQLALAHTHALALGTTMLLVFLALCAAFSMAERRRFRWGVYVWNAGLALTFAGLMTKGILQVLGNSFATSPAIAGFSGLGHMTLTVAFVLLFMDLGAALKERTGATAVERGAVRVPASLS